MKKLLLSFICILPLFSEEGMWPLNQLPKDKIYEKYQATLEEEWVQNAQYSCLRVSIGGSASFISSQGLVMTNHHVGSRAIYDCSTPEKDLMKEGFYAKTLEDELNCPNLYMDQLVSIQDVTEAVNQAVTNEMTLEEKETARKEAIAKIKERAKEDTALYPEVVKLYQGARYHLYYYKRYDDVRLVMAPEKRIASFGGDIENFEFPRHCLDMTFFRIYEDGKPLHNLNYFKWSIGGPQKGEPLFVLGHPGRTERLFTHDHLRFHRDCTYPLITNFIDERIAFYDAFSSQGAEETRIASQDRSRYANSQKAYVALNRGLQGETILSNKEKSEASLTYKQPWNSLRTALDEAREYFEEYFYLEGTGSHYCKLFVWARTLLRLADEQKKENEERLKEYIDSEIPTLKMSVVANEPIYLDYETAHLQDSLERMRRTLGDTHPAALAASKVSSEELIKKTKLHDPEVRKYYLENPEALETTTDPLILFARELDPQARSVRKKMEGGMIAATNEAYAQIVPYLFEQQGEEMYPDATFTLRLAVGELKGYHENGAYLEPCSTIHGALVKDNNHYNQEPFALPKSWLDKKEELKEDIPFNFVSTHDIIGGNSGSPVINMQQEVVGLIFDGNAQSLTWDFEYDEEQGRAISVHSKVILYALDTIYEADRIVKEILRG